MYKLSLINIIVKSTLELESAHEELSKYDLSRASLLSLMNQIEL